MPLIPRKSSKMEPEMPQGKPSIAIALSVQRKNKKKMAQGGGVEATKEKRADADDQDDLMRGHEKHSSDISATDEDMTNEDKAKDSREMSMESELEEHNPDENAKSEGMAKADDKSARAVAMMAAGGIAKSIADAIMMKKKYADGGEVDISKNADESFNTEDDLSWNALRKENYSESEGLDDLDYDTDKSVGDDIDGDKHDMISMIRKKMKASGRL